MAMAVALAGCGLEPPGAGAGPRWVPAGLIGTWRWHHVVDDGPLLRVEREEWRLRASGRDGPPGEIGGHYLREVAVTSRDAPFRCNQAMQYRQRALYAVRAEVDGGALRLVETSYRTEPSPCDRGFRQTTSYAVALDGIRAGLTYVEGSGSDPTAPRLGHQVLWQVDGAIPAPFELAWNHGGDHRVALADVAGQWRWSHDSVGPEHTRVHEEERWNLAVREAAAGASGAGSDDRVEGTYVRVVTVERTDGGSFACAGGPRYRFEDRYLVEGRREEAHFTLREVDVSAGDHPCLRKTPRRVLDAATFEALGDMLVLEWRGDRHQVLRR